MVSSQYAYTCKKNDRVVRTLGHHLLRICLINEMENGDTFRREFLQQRVASAFISKTSEVRRTQSVLVTVVPFFWKSTQSVFDRVRRFREAA